MFLGCQKSRAGGYCPCPYVEEQHDPCLPMLGLGCLQVEPELQSLSGPVLPLGIILVRQRAAGTSLKLFSQPFSPALEPHYGDVMKSKCFVWENLQNKLCKVER